MPDIPAYHSPGRCIYCMKEFPPEQLREEHIIPLALGGTWRIEHAACFPCQNDTNRLYENAALNSDMIRVPRALLELKRRRQKQKPPIWFPPLFPSNTASATNVGHLPQKTVARDEYPALFAMIVMEPPGKLAPSYTHPGDEIVDRHSVVALRPKHLGRLFERPRLVEAARSTPRPRGILNHLVQNSLTMVIAPIYN